MTVVDWFMTDDPGARIAAFTWFNDGPQDAGPMAVGKLTFASRETTNDTWGPSKTVADGVTLHMARILTKGEGFTVEVASSTRWQPRTI